MSSGLSVSGDVPLPWGGPTLAENAGVLFDTTAAADALDACDAMITRLRWFKVVHADAALAAIGTGDATWTGAKRSAFDLVAIAIRSSADGTIGDLGSVRAAVETAWLDAAATQDAFIEAGDDLDPLPRPDAGSTFNDLYDDMYENTVERFETARGDLVLPTSVPEPGWASGVPDKLQAFGTAMRGEADSLILAAGGLGDALTAIASYVPAFPALDEEVRGLASRAALHGDEATDVGVALAD